MSIPFTEMDRDDDDGVGYVAESHYLKSPTAAEQQAMRLLQVPGRDGREGSMSSSLSDLDVPIYSSENLTTRHRREVQSTKKLDKEPKENNHSTSTVDTSCKSNDLGFNGRLAFAIAASALGSSFQHGYNTGVLNNPQKPEDSDEEDSGNEDEVPESGCGEDGLVNIRKINASDSVKPFYLHREVCVTQSYIIITSVTGSMYCVCHGGYFMVAIAMCDGKHAHVNSHYKRAIECCEDDLQCKVCDQNLYQIISPEIIEKWVNNTMVARTGEIPSDDSVIMVFSFMVAIFCVGGMIGGAITGIVAERFGRKGGLLLNNILVLIAVICMSSSKAAASYELTILGRFFIGINSGLNAGLAPMYLAEISPVNLRGAVGTVYQLVITISILIAQIVSLRSLLGTADHWPTLLALTIIPAIFQMATLPFCPESPKYLLLSKGRELEAQKALSWLRGTLAVHEEMDGMRAEYDAMKMVPRVTVTELITNSALRIPLIIALTVMVAQQLSGINAVMFFSSKIFSMAGLNEENATYATLGMGGINVLMTVVSLFLVEKAGRKTLLLVGFAGMTVDTALLTVTMLFADQSKVLGVFCVIFVLIYVIMFACGPGSIPWFLVSELFNQSARPTASALAVCINWTANFLVGLAFLPLATLMGPYVFIIFVVLQALFLIFIYKKVPETKNKSLEEISAMFRQQSYQ